MNIDQYKQLYSNIVDSAPGWKAIDRRLREVYGDQKPSHWGTIIKAMIGGPDPIDGISAYQCRDGGVDHLHFCTYGFSSLYYDEESVGGEFSKFGFEMTFRLASDLPPVEQPNWVLNLIQNLGRYVFKSGRWFEPLHWIAANGPICLGQATDLVGLVFVIDPVLGSIDTPHGKVDFLQAVGITSRELADIQSKHRTVEQIVDELQKQNPLLITDLSRTS